MKENITCVGLILGVLGILYGLMLVLKFVTDTFPIIVVPLVPVYFYLFYREIQMMRKRRAFAAESFDEDYHLLSFGRFYVAKLALFYIGFMITFMGLIHISEIALVLMMAIAIPIGMYRILEIGEDIKITGISHNYGD